MHAALALLLAGVDVTGDVTCPSADEVVRKLRPLLPPAETSGPRHQVRLSRSADALAVELRDAEGTRLAERRLGLGAACADLASAAAVVIATWEVELRGQGALSLWLQDKGAATAPPARSTPRLWWISLGGYGAAVPGSSTSLAADVEVSVGRESGAVSGLLELLFVGDHRIPLGPGRARWRRYGAALGARVGAGGEAWQVAFSASALVSLLTMGGEGFEADRGDTALDGGAAAGLRLIWKAGRARPWLGATLLGWPMPRTLKLEGGPDTSDFPRWEALFGAGVSFSVSR